MYNLVENAIKYNHSGGKVTVNIHLSEEITDTSTSDNYAFLEVSDTGIGIPPEYQEKIFTPFFRVDKSRSRAMGGAGLGLALVSEIVRQHNGQVKSTGKQEKRQRDRNHACQSEYICITFTLYAHERNRFAICVQIRVYFFNNTVCIHFAGNSLFPES